MWFYINFIGLLIHTISIPYDNGANIKGSSSANKFIIPELKKINNIKIDREKTININKHLFKVFSNGFMEVWNSMNENKFPITIGGDHTVSISSISAINEYCNMKNEKLGVIWCDAHADFNTIETSPSKNLHGMPVAILCGHTLKSLKFGNGLEPYQFGYYGLRDIDTIEFDRFQEYNMKILESDNEIDEFINIFDKIHISFDLDCLDPEEFDSVNTPVSNGKTIKEVKYLFNKIRESKKLISLDVVEYNPENNNNTKINTEKNTEIIGDIIKELF